MEELTKKYGYSNPSKISEYIAIYENREAILGSLRDFPYGKPISYYRALRVLKELKKQQQQEETEKFDKV